MSDYPGYLRTSLHPFDPIELIRLTEEKVYWRDTRKYTGFFRAGLHSGISTGYLVGCCLRCVFCWVDLSRDLPDRYGQFYTPDEVVGRLVANALKWQVTKLRISGGEPTEPAYLNLLRLGELALGVRATYQYLERCDLFAHRCGMIGNVVLPGSELTILLGDPSQVLPRFEMDEIARLVSE